MVGSHDKIWAYRAAVTLYLWTCWLLQMARATSNRSCKRMKRRLMPFAGLKKPPPSEKRRKAKHKQGSTQAALLARRTQWGARRAAAVVGCAAATGRCPLRAHAGALVAAAVLITAVFVDATDIVSMNGRKQNEAQP